MKFWRDSIPIPIFSEIFMGRFSAKRLQEALTRLPNPLIKSARLILYLHRNHSSTPFNSAKYSQRGQNLSSDGRYLASCSDTFFTSSKLGLSFSCNASAAVIA